MNNQLSAFLREIITLIENQLFIKVTIGNKRQKSADLKNVFIKPVLLKNVVKLCFIYRYPTKDITKNFDVKEAIILIEKMLQNEFYNADVFSADTDIHFAIQKNESIKIIKKTATLSIKSANNQHNKEKVRILKTADSIYLKELGITAADGHVKKDMQDKFKQINRYIEIIEGIIKDLKFSKALEVVDMGCGKGYLTFALYDYITNNLNLSANITGIELRDELVKKCNQIAAASHFEHLHFKAGTIQNAVLPNTDILIALHACDTATDEAIYSGIKVKAKVIICAPCCHKQIRKEIAPKNEIQSIVKHGILLERQAEITTDAIRALLMEAHGYKTKVFEFIATEHTPKNVLIVGIKSEKNEDKTSIDKVAALKSLFGIKIHHLETLLELL